MGLFEKNRPNIEKREKIEEEQKKILEDVKLVEKILEDEKLGEKIGEYIERLIRAIEDSDPHVRRTALERLKEVTKLLEETAKAPEKIAKRDKGEILGETLSENERKTLERLVAEVGDVSEEVRARLREIEDAEKKK